MVCQQVSKAHEGIEVVPKPLYPLAELLHKPNVLSDGGSICPQEVTVLSLVLLDGLPR